MLRKPHATRTTKSRKCLQWGRLLIRIPAPIARQNDLYVPCLRCVSYAETHISDRPMMPMRWGPYAFRCFEAVDIHVLRRPPWASLQPSMKRPLVRFSFLHNSSKSPAGQNKTKGMIIRLSRFPRQFRRCSSTFDPIEDDHEMMEPIRSLQWPYWLLAI